MADTQKIELKSCPFCGGGAELFTVQHGGTSDPDPDSYAHGLCLSIGGACDMALNSTKEFDNADK